MSEPAPTRGLAARLRELRVGWSVTQRQLSVALGLSGALVSSWENGSAVPPEERLYAYARFFATRRSVLGDPQLIPSEDLTPDEEEVRSTLIDELVRLREESLAGPEPRVRDTGALGGRFWYFPDGQTITILCTPLSQEQLGYSADPTKQADLTPVAQYCTNPLHPNYVRNLGNGDIDALLELVGHLRAENPTAEVRWLTYNRVTSSDELTGHLIVLGSGDIDRTPPPTGDVDMVNHLQSQVEFPVFGRWPSHSEFGGEFVVPVDGTGSPTTDREHSAGEEVYRPRFLRDETDPERPRIMAAGAPQLTSDVAYIYRGRNPFNPTARLTMLAGIFSRGTYGAIRAFTDATFRTRNEEWLNQARSADDFWLLFSVAVIGGNTITPDLTRAAQRLRMPA